MTIDTEKLRALSRGCEYTVKATESGDVSELWAVRFDVMGRPYDSRIGVTSHGVAALIAAAVNALPELLDALATAAQVSDRVQTIADESFGPFPVEPADTCLTYIERGIFGLQQALATAEAERLTLARALLESAPAALDGDPDAYFERRDAANDLAARIVAEADAASKEVRRG